MPGARDDKPNDDGAALGPVCRHCGCKHFPVVYTRRRPNGVILRRRECRHCGRRITTRERIVGE